MWGGGAVCRLVPDARASPRRSKRWQATAPQSAPRRSGFFVPLRVIRGCASRWWFVVIHEDYEGTWGSEAVTKQPDKTAATDCADGTDKLTQRHKERQGTAYPCVNGLPFDSLWSLRLCVSNAVSSHANSCADYNRFVGQWYEGYSVLLFSLLSCSCRRRLWDVVEVVDQQRGVVGVDLAVVVFVEHLDRACRELVAAEQVVKHHLGSGRVPHVA